MPKYLVLARNTNEQRRDMSAEEMQRVIAKYMAWSDRLRQAGRLANSNKLRDAEGRVLRRTGGRLAVTDGPFTESKEVLGGYWLVEAASYDDMIELLKDHPHLEYWPTGTLEIRQIHDFAPPR